MFPDDVDDIFVRFRIGQKQCDIDLKNWITSRTSRDFTHLSFHFFDNLTLRFVLQISPRTRRPFLIVRVLFKNEKPCLLIFFLFRQIPPWLCQSIGHTMHLTIALENSTSHRISNIFSFCFQVFPLPSIRLDFWMQSDVAEEELLGT